MIKYVKENKWLIALIAVAFLAFILASCEGPSEAEDAQQANTESIVQFVEAKWADAPQKSRDSACSLMKLQGIDPVLNFLAKDAEDSSTEFRNAMRDILERDC